MVPPVPGKASQRELGAEDGEGLPAWGDEICEDKDLDAISQEDQFGHGLGICGAVTGRDPWKHEGSGGAVGASAAARTAIATGAGATFPSGAARRRLRMQLKKLAEEHLGARADPRLLKAAADARHQAIDGIKAFLQFKEVEKASQVTAETPVAAAPTGTTGTAAARPSTAERTRVGWRGRALLSAGRACAWLVVDGLSALSEYLAGALSGILGPPPPWVPDSEAEEAAELERALWGEEEGGWQQDHGGG